MSLIELYQDTPSQIEEKHIEQIIKFAGSGKLTDGGKTSEEFRNYLKQVSSSLLKRYVDECLQKSFNDSGIALQDVINELGRRLGFKVTNGRYRGIKNEIGYDGIWQYPNGHSLIIEVKTTDAYRIALKSIINYRKALAKIGTINFEKSSMLIVVGRTDTGDLEAQVRGSRNAWDIRLISADAIVRLVEIKEEVDDPFTINRIHEILIPHEFTKLDDIVEILFSTAEGIKQDEIEEVKEKSKDEPKFIPVAFHDECILKVQEHLGKKLIKNTKSKYATANEDIKIVCAVSKEYDSDKEKKGYWFAHHPHQSEYLKDTQNGYLVFGCGSEQNVLMIPYSDFSVWKDGLNITEREDRMYWHVQIFNEENHYSLRRKKDVDNIDLTKYLI